jgi:hypothetical protein
MTILEREKLVRDKFALLAKVGVQKRRASQCHRETEYYCGIATEALAVLRDAVDTLQSPDPIHLKSVAKITSRQHHLTRRLLGFWPQNLESQNLHSDLLTSPGLETTLGETEDGYLTLSSGPILKNVERIIAATKEELQKV